ncbi:NEDD4 family-interacting protein 2 [Periophthalmus magnuspinnatus]|uniref:NEDD4 family-interacting protein 2 n=1 Tax=Periophthalmus magnuspinnatus TaxID=409849 RepID=UPI00145B7583|nr:NEDD4 family-interacting protein 2 [Periophthalmus magnuspinnatus]XP_055082413.1 NEDD4 family-interacting protein 2 [Periophthalmus magnuspinnatus]
MDPASRYQVLHNEDDSSEAQPSTSAPPQPGPSSSSPSSSHQNNHHQQHVNAGFEGATGEESGASAQADAPPPPYATIDLGATASTPGSSFHGDFPVPPPYSVATSLPTYDEAEKAKAAAMATSSVDVLPRDDEFPPRDDFSDADQLRVGNDGIFMLAFFMAFLFNWIGFCLSFCLTNTIAGRYGAICGFGLSLIKWILIVRFSDYFYGYFNGQYWLWWIFLLLGLLLFFRGFVNYLKVRNMSENLATSHRTRLFFLY